MFISSDDSKIFHTNNKYYDFIVELGRTYQFLDNSPWRSKNQWFVALQDINLQSNKKDDDLSLIDDIIVSCDFIVPSFVKGTELRILRQVTLNENAQLDTINHPYYMQVNRTHFSNIKITLLDKNLQRLSVGNNWPEGEQWNLSCTLHFMKM